MSTPRLQRRVKSAIPISMASLREHRLTFHKKSKDGSAKCDIVHTRNPNDIVYGVVFEMLVCDKPILDRYEGLGSGYEEKPVVIIQHDGRSRCATAYYASHIDASMRPYHWYKQHVLRGAREHALPAEHVEAIAAVASVADPDRQNHINELSIYRSV